MTVQPSIEEQIEWRRKELLRLELERKRGDVQEWQRLERINHQDGPHAQR
jgi:hypothetical protein